MKATSKFFFCCLNSKKTQYIEYILLLVNILCLIFYIIFLSTISWGFIHILYKFLYYLNLVFLLISIIVNSYFIYLRKKRLINSKMNNIALSLTVFIIIICFIAIIINCYSSYSIFSQFKQLNEQKIVFYNSKKDNIISILSNICIDVVWFLILHLWLADLVRIKIKREDTFYNYLKTKSFKKNFYLFKEEYNKESNEQLQNLGNKNKIKKNMKSTNSHTENLKFSANNELIDDNNTNISNINIKNNSITLNISNISNSSNPNHSKASSSLSDSYQKPVNMIIIGTDEKGFPIYAKQNSFDKSQISNESDSFSNRDKKLNFNNFIKFNDITLNGDDNMNDIENTNFEKNHILEKENDEIKKVEKVNENNNENDNDNNNEYKDHFIPLENGEIEKEIENKDTDEQKTKINQ